MKRLSDLDEELLDLDEEDFDDEEPEEDYDTDYGFEDRMPGVKIMIPVVIGIVVLALLTGVAVLILMNRGEKEPAAWASVQSPEEISDPETETETAEPDENRTPEPAETDPEETVSEQEPAAPEAEEEAISEAEDPQPSSMSTEQGTEVDVARLLPPAVWRRRTRLP